VKIVLRLMGLGKGGGLLNTVMDAAEGCTVNDLVEGLPEDVRTQVQQVQVLLAVNGRRVGREEWGTWRLRDGDTMSVLQAMVGG
jgi:thiamine biosynthesis protein ThiS